MPLTFDSLIVVLSYVEYDEFSTVSTCSSEFHDAMQCTPRYLVFKRWIVPNAYKIPFVLAVACQSIENNELILECLHYLDRLKRIQLREDCTKEFLCNMFCVVDVRMVYCAFEFLIDHFNYFLNSIGRAIVNTKLYEVYRRSLVRGEFMVNSKNRRLLELLLEQSSKEDLEGLLYVYSTKRSIDTLYFILKHYNSFFGGCCYGKSMKIAKKMIELSNYDERVVELLMDLSKNSAERAFEIGVLGLSDRIKTMKIYEECRKEKCLTVKFVYDEFMQSENESIRRRAHDLLYELV